MKYHCVLLAKISNNLDSHNIIGEIFGAINAMDWAVSNGYSKIKIYHDYEGLSKWITGEWKAKTQVSKMYVSIYRGKYDGVIETAFEKVKGHSGNKYNDEADSLAKMALEGGKYVAIEGDSWFSISNFNDDILNKLIDVVKEIERGKNKFDIIILDEAHVTKNPSSQ